MKRSAAFPFLFTYFNEWRFMKKLLRLVFTLLFFVLVVLLITRTWAFESKQVWLAEAAPPHFAQQSFKRLEYSLRLPTPAVKDFHRLARQQQKQFPNLFEQLQSSQLNQGSYLYKWEGRNPQLPPILLVFNVQQPFAHRPLRNDSLWHSSKGRIEAQASLEVLSQLLSEKGPIPERSLYLAFLHGEEQASALAALLQKEQLSFSAIFIAESGFLPNGQLPKWSESIALIGRAAQGRAQLSLNIPAKDTAARTEVQRLLAEQALDWCFDQHYQAFLNYIAPELALEYRLLFANSHLLGFAGRSVLRYAPIWPRLYTGGFYSSTTDSSFQLQLHWPASTQALALSQQLSKPLAEAGFSLSNLEINYLPSKSNPTKGYAFGLLESSIKKSWPSFYSLPVASIEAPISQPFFSSFEQAYAFSPLALNENGRAAEIIDASAYEQCQRFYYHLLAKALF